MDNVFHNIKQIKQVDQGAQVDQTDKKHTDNCFGWLKCGKRVKHKGYSVYQLVKNTILFKGVSYRTEQSARYIKDPHYLPGQHLGSISSKREERAVAPQATGDQDARLDPHLDLDRDLNQELNLDQSLKWPNFIFLADTPQTAAIYTKDNDYSGARIITVRTLYKLNLLDISDPETMRKVFDKCTEECKQYLQNGFLLDNNFVSKGRLSHYIDDYKMVQELMTSFPFLDGYAFEQSRDFHEEIVIFRPNIVLERYPIEYRPTGVQIDKVDDWSDYPVELWFETNNGKYIRPVIIEYINRQLPRRHKYNSHYNQDSRDAFINDVKMSELPRYVMDSRIFKRRLNDYADKLIQKSFKSYIYNIPVSSNENSESDNE